MLHKHIPQGISIGIVTCMAAIVLFFSYAKSPDLREQTVRMLDSTADAFGNMFIRSSVGSSNETELASRSFAPAETESDDIVSSNADNSATILEPKQASDEDLMPTELEGFKPSPESEWARAYLQILGLKQEDLGFNISYVHEWQQTGGLNRDLALNSKGTDVKLVQYLLYRLAPSFGISFPAKSITGTYGPQTRNAIIALQKKLSINPDGNFNNETRLFFDSLYFKDLCPDADPKQDKSFENVSRRISVPMDYIPSDLIRLPRTIRTAGVMCLSREPARRLDEMFSAAEKDGIDLAVTSAYRSSRTQALLLDFYKRTLGKAGLAGIAESGHSEHQLGTTVDLSGKSVQYSGISDAFGKTPEGIWLAANSYKFGFILSYPQDKQKDTGYIYEPWHFRYLGVDTAKDIFEEKMTIQEYLDLVTKEFEN